MGVHTQEPPNNFHHVAGLVLGHGEEKTDTASEHYGIPEEELEKERSPKDEIRRAVPHRLTPRYEVTHYSPVAGHYHNTSSDTAKVLQESLMAVVLREKLSHKQHERMLKS